MLKNSWLFPLILLITIFSVCSAGRTVAQEEDLIHELPCVYRGEVWSVLYSDPTKTDYYFLDNDRAYLGAYTYSASIGGGAPGGMPPGMDGMGGIRHQCSCREKDR